MSLGEPHHNNCRLVNKAVRYGVYLRLDKYRATKQEPGVRVGTFVDYEPHESSADQMEFTKNESTWCSDNALDGVTWLDIDSPRSLKVYMDRTKNCSCAPLYFMFEVVEDPGPFIWQPD